jgi:hypothetical protein
LKDYNSVSWFEVRKESVRFQAFKWSIAVLTALLLNWLYIEGLPDSHGLHRGIESQPEENNLQIEMVEPEKELQYVETNPDNPENEPDDTTNISDRTQQAAQENVAGAQNNPTPFLKGDDAESPKIVEGEMPVEEQAGNPVQASSGQQVTQPQEQQEQQQMQAEQIPQPESLPSIEAPSIYDLPEIAPPPPTPDFIDKVESDSEEGVDLKIIEKPEVEAETNSQQEGEDKRININIPPSVAAELSKAIEAQKAQQQQPNHQQGQNSPAQPMPRPRLSPKVLPGPLLNSQVYAARMGPIGFDAKFSQFGYYLSRMFETIQMQWYSLLADVTIGQEKRPAFVIVEYTLDSEGKVVESKVLDTNAGQLATLLCRDAVESRAPFGLWTEQMVDQLGDQTQIILKFIYM